MRRIYLFFILVVTALPVCLNASAVLAEPAKKEQKSASKDRKNQHQVFQAGSEIYESARLQVFLQGDVKILWKKCGFGQIKVLEIR